MIFLTTVLTAANSEVIQEEGNFENYKAITIFSTKSRGTTPSKYPNLVINVQFVNIHNIFNHTLNL